jgi:uncharacterized protein with gpF-like domain
MPIMLPRGTDKKRKRERDMRPIKPARAVRRAYLDALKSQTDIIKAQSANLSDIVSSGADRKRVAAELERMAAETRARLDGDAPRIASAFARGADASQKKQAEKALATSLGVDFAKIIDSPAIAERVDLAIDVNTSLIKSIGAEHWGKVGKAVLDNYTGRLKGSLTERIQEIGGITETRAAFIARDQTAKLTGALTQARQEENGIDEYIWRTAQDSRVVGDPGGKYPEGSEGHMDHYSREGQVFRWDSPPPDGAPGEAFNCRCYAQGRVNLDKLKALYT